MKKVEACNSLRLRADRLSLPSCQAAGSFLCTLALCCIGLAGAAQAPSEAASGYGDEIHKQQTLKTQGDQNRFRRCLHCADTGGMAEPDIMLSLLEEADVAQYYSYAGVFHSNNLMPQSQLTAAG